MPLVAGGPSSKVEMVQNGVSSAQAAAAYALRFLARGLMSAKSAAFAV